MTPPSIEICSNQATDIRELRTRSRPFSPKQGRQSRAMLHAPAVFPARVVAATAGDGTVELVLDHAPGMTVQATLAMHPAPHLLGGECVLAVPGPAEAVASGNSWFVTALLRQSIGTESQGDDGSKSDRPMPNDWVLADGSRLQMDRNRESIELRDPSDRVCFRYNAQDQSVTIAAEGDLRLESTDGNVHISARNDVQVTGQRAIHVVTPTLEADAIEAELRGTRLQITYAQLRWLGKRCEMYGEQMMQVVRNLYSHVTECFQLKAGRARAIVEESAETYAGKVRVKSKEDVTIDGKHIHLG